MKSLGKLEITGDTDSPHVKFDNRSGWLYMGGSSLPENVIEFYSPILNWLKEYKESTQTTTLIEFNFDYLNTASTNIMARIIEFMQDIQSNLNSVKITWYYTTGDYDMKELGSELLEGINCEYQIVEN